MQTGIGNYGRRRLVVLTPRPTRCPICNTDLEKTTNCPANCLTKEKR